MKFYGVEAKEKVFFTSYFEHRVQYTEVDTKRTLVKSYFLCSVIQGSKLSRTLYNLYTNEVPVLDQLLQDDNTTKKLTGDTITNKHSASQYIVNYVENL